MIKLAIAMSSVLIATILIFRLSEISKHIGWTVSGNTYLADMFKYQMLLLLLSSGVLLLSYSLNGESFFKFFALGNIAAPAHAVPILGIKEDESWFGVGINLTIIITLATGLFIYLQAKGGTISWANITPYLGWVLLFSFMNSFSEEVIYRLALVVPLYDVVSAGNIMLISATLFAVVHYAGMPNGVVGMLMAGVLGWILTKSVIETQGMFWAWFIHFIQDVVIFTGLLFIKAKENISQAAN